MFKAPWKFSTRTRRPPKDPVNAVLSFGYVVVGNELQSLLDGAGFDPYLGFYHAVEYGRPSLAAYPPFFVWRFRIAGSAKGKANCGLGAGNAILS